MSDTSTAKREMRRIMRIARLKHWQALPASHQALVFSRPPNPLLSLIGNPQTVWLYAPMAAEVPTIGYARFFQSQGTKLALPWFENRESVMQFKLWGGLDEELEVGPFGALQPQPTMPMINPDTVFVPLLAFDQGLTRLGQGGGHYDRYLDANPKVHAIGLAWTVQQVENVPVEPHDRALNAIITEQRIFGPMEREFS